MTVLAHELNDCKLNKNKKKKRAVNGRLFSFTCALWHRINSEEENHVYITA